MFSKTCEYAIRALIVISNNSVENRFINAKQIAEGGNIPLFYVAKIMQTLVKSGVIQSSKGAYGGFYLPCNGKKVRLLDVIIAIDGKHVLTSCGIGLEKCTPSRPCPLHDSFQEIRNNLVEMLCKTTIYYLARTLEESGFSSINELCKNRNSRKKQGISHTS